MPTLFTVSKADARDAYGAVRCFKCPRERQGDEPGSHFLDPSKMRGALRRGILHVCPAHYRQFAIAEQARWEPLFGPTLPSGDLSMPPLEPAADSRLALAGAPANPRAAEVEPARAADHLLLPMPAIVAT